MKKFAKIISSPDMKQAAVRNMEVLPKYQLKCYLENDIVKFV